MDRDIEQLLLLEDNANASHLYSCSTLVQNKKNAKRKSSAHYILGEYTIGIKHISLRVLLTMLGQLNLFITGDTPELVQECARNWDSVSIVSVVISKT